MAKISYLRDKDRKENYIHYFMSLGLKFPKQVTHRRGALPLAASLWSNRNVWLLSSYNHLFLIRLSNLAHLLLLRQPASNTTSIGQLGEDATHSKHQKEG